MTKEREDYKERLREAGRLRLEEFRRQKGSLGKGTGTPAASPGLGTEAVGRAAYVSASVELTTFRVLTQPATAVAGAFSPPEAEELRLLAPALASTSLGPLPPGSACIPPPQGPLSSSPCSVASAAGSASASSLASTGTGYVAGAAPSGAADLSTGTSPGPEGGLGASGDEEAGVLVGSELGRSLSRGPGGGGDQALVDMLLAQVEALMREKAALLADNGSLRQQVEQLTELVGWLSLERSGPEGDALGAEAEAVVGVGCDYFESSSYGLSPSRPTRGCVDLDDPGEGYRFQDSPSADCAVGSVSEPHGAGDWGGSASGDAEEGDCGATACSEYAGGGGRARGGGSKTVPMAHMGDRSADGQGLLGPDGWCGDAVSRAGGQAEFMGVANGRAEGGDPGCGLRRDSSIAEGHAHWPVVVEGGPLGPVGPLGPGG